VIGLRKKIKISENKEKAEKLSMYRQNNFLSHSHGVLWSSGWKRRYPVLPVRLTHRCLDLIYVGLCVSKDGNI
jgi:hypothetical protein